MKKTMDRVLLCVALFLIVFTITMIVLFCLYQTIPDTLIVSVFGACTGEVSICGWIKTVKEKAHETTVENFIENDGEDNV